MHLQCSTPTTLLIGEKVERDRLNAVLIARRRSRGWLTAGATGQCSFSEVVIPAPLQVSLVLSKKLAQKPDYDAREFHVRRSTPRPVHCVRGWALDSFRARHQSLPRHRDFHPLRQPRSAAFSATYGGQRVSVHIRDGVVRGRVPRRAQALVLEWLDLHREALLED